MVGLAHGGPDELNKWLQRILSWGMGSETLPPLLHSTAAAAESGKRDENAMAERGTSQNSSIGSRI